MKHMTMCALVSALMLGLGTACAASDVKPPKLPHIDQPLTDAQIAKLPKLEQPPALKKALTDLSQGSIDERKAKLKAYVLSHLIFVEGGSFQMGDFGPIWLESKLPLTEETDDDVLHKVTLSSFSIEAYKVSYAEFDVYSDATHTTRAGMDEANGNGAYRNPYVPAGVYWPQANDYCQWLGKLTELPFALPTEAQWEYAARNRGKFFAFSTSNGNVINGQNIADPGYSDKLAPQSPVGGPYHLFEYPVGLFPQSPLGLYDMGVNGFEWTHDFYNADYYARSKLKDPQGPGNGDKRVARGYDPGSNFYGGYTTLRRNEAPMLTRKNPLTGKTGPAFSAEYGLRCIINKTSAITK